MPIWIIQFSMRDMASAASQVLMQVNQGNIQQALTAAKNIANSLQVITCASVQSVWVYTPATAPNYPPTLGAFNTNQFQMVMKLATSIENNFYWLTIPAPVSAIVNQDANLSLNNEASIFGTFISTCIAQGATDKYGNTLGDANLASGFVNCRVYTLPIGQNIAIAYSTGVIGSAIIGQAKII